MAAMMTAHVYYDDGACGEGHISNLRCRRSPLPAAPLIVRRRYLIVLLKPLSRCAPQVLACSA
jgi:hypothetical protein